MLVTKFLTAVTILTAALVAGEALALLVGMVFLSQRPNFWINKWNIFLMVSDVLCGLSLIGLVLMAAGGLRDGLIFTITLLSLAAHAFRQWQYYARIDAARFLVNKPLLVVNALKMAGLVCMVGVQLFLFFQPG